MMRLIPVLAFCAGPALAQPVPEGWFGGAIGGVSTSPMVGEDSNAFALPYIAYRSARFSLGFDGGSYTVFDDTRQSFQVLIRPRFPLIDDDVPELSGLSRDIGLDVGATYGFETGPGVSVSLTALQGLTDAQQGQEVDLRFSHQFGQLPVSLYAGAAWQSDELTEYLYGVRPDEAAIGRPAYAPGAAITPYIGVQGMLPVTDRATIIGSVEARQLPGAITDSPIVEGSGTTRATLGVVFNF